MVHKRISSETAYLICHSVGQQDWIANKAQKNVKSFTLYSALKAAIQTTHRNIA